MNPIALPKGFGKATLLAALFTALVGGTAACSSEEGTTPACVQDVDENGRVSGVDNGCNPFARCVIGDQVRPADDCCKSFGAPGEYAYDACMYGYGEGDPPGSGTN